MRMIEYVKRLESAGFTREQAEMSTSVLEETIATLATKEDLQDAVVLLRAETQALGSALRAESAVNFAALEKNLTHTLYKVLGRSLTAAGAVMGLIIGLLQIFGRA